MNRLPAGYIEPAVNFMIFIRRMLVLGSRPGRLVVYGTGLRSMLMEDSAKQQVGALSGHKAPADEGTAL